MQSVPDIHILSWSADLEAGCGAQCTVQFRSHEDLKNQDIPPEPIQEY